MNNLTHEPEVTIGDGVITVHRYGQDARVVANILGVERDPRGRIRRYWLDRRVHAHKESHFHGYSVSGALVTELIPD